MGGAGAPVGVKADIIEGAEAPNEFEQVYNIEYCVFGNRPVSCTDRCSPSAIEFCVTGGMTVLAGIELVK